MCFHWKSLRRQIRIIGEVKKISDEEAEIIILILDPIKIELEHGLQISHKF